VLASILDAEGVAGVVASEVGRPGPGAAPAPGTRCSVRLLGETDWQRCAYPASVLLEALAALSGSAP
jgi:hypothetical protein